MDALVRSISIALFLALAALARPAAATTICVTSANGVGNATQLNNAMRYWQYASDQTVYIHLEQGTYTLLGSGANFNGGEFFYDQNGLDENAGNLGNASLHLVGGFVPGNGCSQRALDPANTTINGKNGGSASSLYIYQRDGQTLVDGLTFTEFGHGVILGSDSDSTATVRDVIMSGNGNGDFHFSALSVYDVGAGTSKFRIENSLFTDNKSNGLALGDQHGSDTTQVIGCTIVNNSGYGLVVGDAFDSDANLNGAMSVFNTIFFMNGLADMFVTAGGNAPDVQYSNYASVSGVITHSHNQNTNPLFVGAGKYELQTNSPFINIGDAESSVAGGYANTDIRGRTRVLGSRADLGAYETLIDDKASQTVNVLNDLPTGATLRAAITTANFNANPTTIKFNVTTDGACPHIIQLGSLLDDITSDITIDGYTQAGAQPNDVVPGYDGTLCMVLRGGGTLDHAFRTSGGGRLTVRGIEFEGFTGAAVHLSSGIGHVVTGNGFAAFGSGLPNKEGVLIDGTASSSQIGSYAFGDRNVFARSTDAAIRLNSNGAGNHVIQGNYIGFNLDGTKRTDAQNKYGIYASDSGSNDISYNFIGGSQLNAIYLTGASTSANHVIENAIGIAPANDAAAGGGGGTCNPLCFGNFAAIGMASGAHGNFVGALGGSGGNNLIVNNLGPGVQVESSAGTGNRVYGNNLIHDNGGYLAIDLATEGATLNDVSDGDYGGNNLQNYPTLSQAMRVGAGVVRISGSLLPQRIVTPRSYRLDVYWTDTCLFSGSGPDTPRGEMKRYVGFANIASDGTEFNLPFSNLDIIAATGLPTPGYLFAVATDKDGNTSEPGPCRTYVDDYIFRDGYE